MIALRDHREGCVLPVRAQPGAKRTRVVGEHAGAIKIAVTAPPENGRANQALIEFLAQLLNVKRSQIELLAGAASRSKSFLIRGESQQMMAARLNRGRS